MSEFHDESHDPVEGGFAENGFADEREPTDIGQFVLVLQIVCGSLIGGVLIFGGFVLLQPPKPPAAEPAISLVGAVFTAASLMTWFLLPLLIDRLATKRIAQLPHEDGRPDTDAVAKALMPQYQTRKILQMAVLEGAAFMNLVAYWLEHIWWSLAIIGALVLLMIFSFPTHGRIRSWARSLIQRWETKSFDGDGRSSR